MGMAMALESCSPATQEIDKFFRYINDVRSDLQSGKSEDKKQKLLTKARKRLLTLIDTEYVGRMSLGKYYDGLSVSEKQEFSRVFHEILAYNLVKTYVPTNFVADQDIKVDFVNEEVKHDPVFNAEANIIHTRFTTDKVVYLIDFYMHPVGKTYKLYDVYVDGASVLLDYQNQFYNMISSKGFPYLLKRLKEKYEQLDSRS